MPFKKNDKNINRSGRKKGVKNKITKDLREAINNFLQENYETVTIKFNDLSPRDQMKFFLELLQYAIPKLQNIKQDADINIHHPMIDAAIKTIKEKRANEK